MVRHMWAGLRKPGQLYHKCMTHYYFRLLTYTSNHWLQPIAAATEGCNYQGKGE